MATKLNKRQRKFIAKAFDCPKEYGYMKNGKCIKHKMTEKPEGPSVGKSALRVLKKAGMIAEKK